ncbi:DNA-binding response regulator [Nostocoides sp. F2B08]|uniref:helix-turn-helix domain-containing protein n=1 Tax=Nostocoides sp. F2B08 TaxID=2653936 RepID=UPI0012637DC6|nr:helix-turn-helix transcriptional regulator [Tetrasphaera sp. F2B08]KAB7744207.1 DNA-binding response regulator [Tetrasphaera sp. F2B08]
MPQDADVRRDGRDALERGRAAVEQRAWDRGCDALTAADDAGLLAEPEDVEGLALCAQLTGRPDLAEAAWARAHEGFVDRGEVRAAVRCAFWLGLVLIVGRGIETRGGAWVARARRLLDEDGPRDCPEWGYLLLPDALRTLDGDEPDLAYVAFGEAMAIGQRWADDDLMTLGRLGQGQASLRLGEPARGLALLDEAMLSVETGRVSPLASGIVYCAVLIACQQLFDLRRAREWTETFSDWCDAQPGLVPFRGQCLVHRSQVAQLRGDWREATAEADRACRWLSDPPDPALGMAHYQRAELHRIHGEYAAAAASYGAATDCGHDPHPGLALVWLAQGRTEAAVAAMRRALDQTSSTLPEVRDELSRPRSRAESLAASVTIMVSAGEDEAADRACSELGSIADAVGTDVLRAMASHARGQVLLARGRPGDALEHLASARRRWLGLRAPYETACTRVLVSRALRELGDTETAEVELAAADRAFAEAGVEPDRGVRASTTASPSPGDAHGLSAREVEVLRLVATGRTNREIAGRLVISDKTVARHLHNILTKLDLPNRSAATAYAYEHRIL